MEVPEMGNPNLIPTSKISIVSFSFEKELFRSPPVISGHGMAPPSHQHPSLDLHPPFPSPLQLPLGLPMISCAGKGAEHGGPNLQPASACYDFVGNNPKIHLWSNILATNRCFFFWRSPNESAAQAANLSPMNHHFTNLNIITWITTRENKYSSSNGHLLPCIHIIVVSTIINGNINGDG